MTKVPLSLVSKLLFGDAGPQNSISRPCLSSKQSFEARVPKQCLGTRAQIALVAGVFLLSGIPTALGGETDWKAGAARVVITRDKPMWLSGYSSRDKPSEGKVHDLWAKALALEDASGKRCVLVTLDLVGIPREVSLDVCGEIKR